MTKAIANNEVLAMATKAGSGAYGAELGKVTAITLCKVMHDAGITLGKWTAKGKTKRCPTLQAFADARFPNNLTAKGKPVDDDMKGKYASYFKVAVESGKPYSEGNASKKAKGENIMIALAKASSGAEAAGKLMAGFNKMKEANTQLAELAGFLIDAIKDAGFDPAQAAADEEA